MKLSATSLTLALLLPSASLAQVTDLTAGAQSQTRGSLSSTSSQSVQGVLDQQGDLDSRLDTDLDSRLESDLDTDLQVDDSIEGQAEADLSAQARLQESLNASLTAYDRSAAGTRLAAALQQRSEMYAGTDASVSAGARIDRPDTPDMTAQSSGEHGYTYVAVYSSDGYRIGSVTRHDGETGNRIYFDRSQIDATGEVAIPETDAMFDARAQAIILNATRADVTGMSSVG